MRDPEVNHKKVIRFNETKTELSGQIYWTVFMNTPSPPWSMVLCGCSSAAGPGGERWMQKYTSVCKRYTAWENIHFPAKRAEHPAEAPQEPLKDKGGRGEVFTTDP